MKGPQLVVVGKPLLRVTVIIAWYQSWFSSANHYKQQTYSECTYFSLRHVRDSHRISNQVLILIVHYSLELSPSPVCVAATPVRLRLQVRLK